MPGSFFDTNVVIYLASDDPEKADKAEKLIGAGGTISVQVLNEVANVVRRKMHMSWDEAHVFLSTIRDLLAVVPVTVETHDQGLALAERHNISVYDAMIAAAALEAGCTTLWTEDLQTGALFGGRLRVANPFS